MIWPFCKKQPKPRIVVVMSAKFWVMCRGCGNTTKMEEDYWLEGLTAKEWVPVLDHYLRGIINRCRKCRAETVKDLIKVKKSMT